MNNDRNKPSIVCSRMIQANYYQNTKMTNVKTHKVVNVAMIAQIPISSSPVLLKSTFKIEIQGLRLFRTFELCGRKWKMTKFLDSLTVIWMFSTAVSVFFM